MNLDINKKAQSIEFSQLSHDPINQFFFLCLDVYNNFGSCFGGNIFKIINKCFVIYS